MELIFYPLTAVILIIILKDIFLLSRVPHFISPPRNKLSTPFVSVFVAARNESTTIRRCVEGLLDQDYPSEKYEILIGNDQSEDDTMSVISTIAKENPQVKSFDISELVVPARGKMNVLVQLISNAKGDYFLFTDADTKVGISWISTLVNTLQSGYGVVTGTSVIRNDHFFQRFQNLDWIQAQAMVKILEDNGTRVTSLGNNMGVTKEAYESVGGFHGIPFSITEDYELYISIISNGYKPLHIFNRGALAETLSMASFGALLEQRKRWMFGVIRLPNSIILFLLLNAIYVPVLILLLFVAPLTGIVVGIVRWVILSEFLKRVQKLINQKGSVLWLLPFEIYQSSVNLTSLIYYLLPIKARWKGRPFS